MTPRFAKLLFILGALSLVLPAINLAGRNLYLYISSNEDSQYILAASNGVCHLAYDTSPSSSGGFDFARDAYQELMGEELPAPIKLGPLEFFTERRADSMMWLRFHSTLGDSTSSYRSIEFPFLLIPAGLFVSALYFRRN